MTFTQGDTAIVITDPQNDFLAEGGFAWFLVKQSVIDNNTIDNIEKLLMIAEKKGILVAISPHYYYDHDLRWKFGGLIEQFMHEPHEDPTTGDLSDPAMFYRPNRYTLANNSGADFLDKYKTYIFKNGKDGKMGLQDNIIIASPHKVYGPEQNDLALQLRKQRIDKVILAGMSANLCTESHMRGLVEAGFEVAVAKDGTAAADLTALGIGHGYDAAIINFKFIASRVMATDDIINELESFMDK